MPGDFLPKPALGFLLRFVVIFGILIVPWPGWNRAYSFYFQALGRMAFGSSTGSNRVVILEPVAGNVPDLDTQITLVNTVLADSSGHAKAKRSQIDSRSIGWLPTALTASLVLATPIPWKRRLVALACGLGFIHLFILLTLQSWIWNKSVDLSLLKLSAFWQQAVDDLNYTLMYQLGASFSVPVLIWVLVTFRRQDAIAT